jgi:glucosamine--fructose-6-phosphate aminotransferase (isomerizing)
MCGIFAYAGNNQIGQQYILKGLKNLEYRGYDSWGIALKTKSGVWLKKEVGKIGSISASTLPSSSFGIGHTRWATHGAVTKENSHPHQDCQGNIYLVHNGIIENFDQLKSKLKDHQFKSQTDSEILVHLIEEENKTHNFRESVSKAFNQTTGLSAIISFHQEKDEFVAIRKGSPLVLGFGYNQNFIASDPSALAEHTKKVYFLKDGEGAYVSKDKIICFKVKNNQRFSPQLTTIKWHKKQANKGKYPHFMIKEIFDQSKVVANILKMPNKYNKALSEIQTHSNLIFLGCGTASHAAMLGTYLFSTIANLKTSWIVGSELIYHKNLIDKNTLIIALSQSGETMDIIQSVKAAQARGAKILSLVNVEGSTLARLSDITIPLLAGPEKAVASTKAFIAKITHLYLLSLKLSAGRSDRTKIIKSVNNALSPKFISNIQKLAYLIKNHQHIYIVGRGLSYPLALETALKVKEISYIHAEGFAAGELKHGVIALIEKNTPCIVYAPNDQALPENIAAAMELKARGGFIIGISPIFHQTFDFHIKIDDLSTQSIFQNTIVGQLLAYYLSVEIGLDPDMPRNLAKSVTVK